MKCQCGNEVGEQGNLQIELKKKMEWLQREHEQYSEILAQCCSTCLSSMSSDIDGEIQAEQYRCCSYQEYTDKFTTLSPNSSLYQMIAARFHSSVNNEIIRIEMHNNPILKDKYDAFKDSHKSNIGEQLLFHGSRHINYNNILEHGFDMSRSKNGLQGRGIYFATDASYSINPTFSETMVLKEDTDSCVVGNMLCCYVYPTNGTGQLDNNYCIRNVNQCYPAFIIYYKC